MNIRTCAALLLAAGLPTAVMAVDYVETEPNETKAQATTNGVITLNSGDSVSGTTTGTLSTPGPTSLDTFRIRATHPASGIYRHRLTISTTGAAGHTGSIRGQSVSGNVINATSDVAIQTSASTTTPARFNQWYGLGTESDIFYRVTGTASTTGTYTSTLQTDAVTLGTFAINPEAGSIRIFPDTATDSAYDTLTHLYDSNFNPIAGWDDADSTGITANLAPGTYYFSLSRFNGAAGRFSRGGFTSVFDFASGALGTSATQGGTQAVGVVIDDPSANVITSSGGAVLAGAYDVAWFTFTVVPSVTPTNPTVTATLTPSSVLNDGVEFTVIRATVTPGTNPTSSFLTTGTVTASGPFSEGMGVVTLLDDGVSPDTVAGDNIFSGVGTPVPATTPGTYPIAIAVTDDQGRNASTSATLTLTGPPPACAAGLSTLSFTNVSGDTITPGVGNPTNTVVTGDFGVAGDINTITITGRYTALGTSWRSEARVQMIAPDGSVYNVGPFTGAPGSVGIWDVAGQVVAMPLEAGTGTWSFEFYESLNDATPVPDHTWSTVCFAANLAATNPTATGSASPSSVVNDGTGSTVLTVNVTPGAAPTSTFVSTGSVTVTSSALVGGTVTLLDNGVAPDVTAGDNIFSASATVVNGTAAGSTPLPYNVTDDQGRTATGNIAFTVTTPPPACSAGLATLTFNNVSSNNAVGGAGNSIVTGDFGFADVFNQFVISGRVSAFGGSWRSEARVQATAPDGSIYLLSFGLPASAGTSDVIDFVSNIGLESGSGTWTFEFYESVADADTPDATWQQICFALNQTPTPLSATDTASSPVARDGVATSTLAVTVTPAYFPNSTDVAVVVDASSVGGSGTLVLLDNGVAPDATAGDNIFTGTTTVAYTTPLGAATLPYTVTDAQGGNFAGSLNFTVSEATGACCTTSGCVLTTIGDCLDVQGGTFAGTGTACVAPTALSTTGAGAFEDISGTGTPVTFTNVDDGVTSVTLPFTFNFFGTDYTSGNVSTNANFQFGANNSTSFSNTAIPTVAVPNNALYVLWDDHDLDSGSPQVHTQLLGTIGVDARFIIQWTNAGQYNSAGLSALPSTFQIALFEDGSFEFRYLNVSTEFTVGDTTTIGYENADGTIAFQSALTRADLNAAAPVSYRGNSTLNDTGICPPLITDCNDNGIDDADDILNGTSQDCNTNSIPDECDILSGTSLDANENGVPDECDPVSPCNPCPADYNLDGGVDGGDLSAFFTDYEAGELECADTNQDGGIDGGDLAAFFSAYEAGGC